MGKPKNERKKKFGAILLALFMILGSGKVGFNEGKLTAKIEHDAIVLNLEYDLYSLMSENSVLKDGIVKLGEVIGKQEITIGNLRDLVSVKDKTIADKDSQIKGMQGDLNHKDSVIEEMQNMIDELQKPDPPVDPEPPIIDPVDPWDPWDDWGDGEDDDSRNNDDDGDSDDPDDGGDDTDGDDRDHHDSHGFDKGKGHEKGKGKGHHK